MTQENETKDIHFEYNTEQLLKYAFERLKDRKPFKLVIVYDGKGDGDASMSYDMDRFLHTKSVNSKSGVMRSTRKKEKETREVSKKPQERESQRKP
jgi:hypothetical protein